MLRSKFLVPVGVRGAWRHLKMVQRRNASRCERFCPTADKKYACPRTCPKLQKDTCPKPRNTLNPFGRGSAAHKEARSVIPKKSVTKQTCSQPSALHPPYSCGNAAPHAAEEFRRVYAEIKKVALDAQILTRVTANNVIEPMVKRNRERTAAEMKRLDALLNAFKPKIDELLGLSLICGSKEQAKLYRLSENFHDQIQLWSCQNKAGQKCVKCRLRQLECLVKERTDMAVDILRTCNRSVTPSSLILCVNLTKSDAKCILERVNSTIKKEIAAIEKIRANFFKEEDEILLDLRKEIDCELKQFDEGLDQCIKDLTKLKNKKCN